MVTANKQLVAEKGCELLELARRKNVNYLFEASVGGGIPILYPLTQCMALVAGASETEDYVPFAAAMDQAARACGVNFIGGYSALVQKGMTRADELLIRSIPDALAATELVCSSVNVGSTKAGINMDAVALMGRIIKETAAKTADRDGLGCAKLVVFCNAVEDNPFMNVQMALAAAELLKADGISARVIDMHTIKPLDEELVLKAARETGAIVTSEEANVLGGLGGAVAEYLAETYPVPVVRHGVNDEFGRSGKAPLVLDAFGINAAGIAEKAKKAVALKK